MIVLFQVSDGIADFNIPHMNTVCVEAQTDKVIHITVYSLFMIYSQIIHSPVGVRKRQRVIDSVENGFLTTVTPPHGSFGINENGRCFLCKALSGE
ncbi:hypothetical protein SDC9_96156 [bioreactor metagenome]|uniref:Uncharacterized protein n=1 Tax=bioreactor metagenome TaxID=1076179 RepID=A0A645A933_9ZZZZ